MRQRVLALLGIVATFSLVALGLVIYNADRQLFDKVIPEHRALHEVEQQTTVLVQQYLNYMFVPGSIDHLDIHRTLASLRENMMAYRNLVAGNEEMEVNVPRIETAIDDLEQAGAQMILLRLELERLFESGEALEDEIRIVFDLYESLSNQSLQRDIETQRWDHLTGRSLPDVRMIAGIKEQVLELFLEIREYQSSPQIDVLDDIREIESRLELSLTLLRIYIENDSDRADEARRIIEVYRKLERLIDQYALASQSAIESVRRVEQAGAALSEILEATTVQTETEGWQNLRQSLIFMGLIMVIGLVGSFLVLYFGIGRILEPLQQLQAAFASIGEGKLQQETSIELKSGDSEVAQLVQAFNSMAEQLRQNAAMQQSFIEHLEEKNTELERFTYTVSHELKSPLVTISGFLGLLKKDLAAGNAEKIDGDMEKIAEAIRTMNRQLEDLLELSRVGLTANPARRFSLHDLCADSVQMLQGLIESTGAEVEIEPDMPDVFADQVRIAEVFTNLIENGIKFSSQDHEPRIQVSAKPQGDRIYCRVQDNGPGIEPGYHQRVFELFDRLDSDVPGTGIGLALAKRIVEIHNGTIWIESEGDGQGCCFCFTLPAQGGNDA